MHQFTTLSIAILATSALAAPAAKQQKSDNKPGLGHFTAAMQGPKNSGPLDPMAAMKHAFGKYDWTFDVTKFDADIPHIDLSQVGKGGPPGHGPPTGAPGAGKTVAKPLGLSENVKLPNLGDLADSISNTVGDAIDDILGGGNGYGDSEPPKTTLSKAVKPTTTKAKKPKSTGVSTQPAAATSSAPPPPAYSAPGPETSSSAAPEPETSSYAAPEPETSSYAAPAPETSSAVVETSSAAAETSSYVAPAPETSSAAGETSVYVAPVPSSTSVESTSAAAAPTSSAEPTTSAAPASTGTYTPSFAFEPTTSAEPSSAPATTQTSAAPVVSSAAPATTSSTYVAPSSTKQSTGGKVTATPESNESEYLSPVTVGGQSLNLNFDTGSADFWVFGSGLSDSQKANHAVFDSSKSSTFQPQSGYSWSIAYGDGSNAAGTVGYDAVVVGGATATKQAVEVATTISDKFAKDVNNDGIVGLAWSSINTVKPQQQKTFFENIMPNLDQPLFTADLRSSSQTSTYEFGTIDTSKYTGDIHYTPIDNSKGHWEFSSTTYTINGQSYTNSNAAPAIADTGTSLILADQATVTAYYGAVSGASMNSQVGGYTYPCSATLPSFGVQIGSSGFIATLPGSAMTYAPLGDGNCFGGLQSNGGGNYQIFGDVLFKQYFAVFNGGAKTFGVAAKSG